MDKHACSEMAEAAALEARESALELYQIAVLMLGDEHEAALLVEEAVAQVEADPCADSAVARHEARARLAEKALDRLVRLHPNAFVNPPAAETTSECLDTDDLPHLSGGRLALPEQAQGRLKLRDSLDQLAPALRAIFVLRAVMGQDGERTAENLHRTGADGAQRWRREHVGTAYRQALCALATSLVTPGMALV